MNYGSQQPSLCPGDVQEGEIFVGPSHKTSHQYLYSDSCPPNHCSVVREHLHVARFPVTLEIYSVENQQDCPVWCPSSTNTTLKMGFTIRTNWGIQETVAVVTASLSFSHTCTHICCKLRKTESSYFQWNQCSSFLPQLLLFLNWQLCSNTADKTVTEASLSSLFRLLHVRNGNCKYHLGEETFKLAQSYMDKLAKHGHQANKAALYGELCALLFAKSHYDEVCRFDHWGALQFWYWDNWKSFLSAMTLSLRRTGGV